MFDWKECSVEIHMHCESFSVIRLMHCAVWMWWNGAGRGSWQSLRGIPTFPAGNGLWCV